MKEALKAKADNLLSKLIRDVDGIVFTRREWLERKKRQGCTAKLEDKPSVQWDRRKFNRMDYPEQKEYQKKLDTKVPSYNIYEPNSSVFTEVTKTEFDYFNSL